MALSNQQTAHTKTSQQTCSNPNDTFTASEKIAAGSTLLSMGGLATSIGTFMAMEGGLVTRGSSLETWGGLGGFAAFVGGAVVAGVATFAAKES